MKKTFFIILLVLPIIVLAARREPKASAVTTKLQENFHNIFVHDYVDMLVFSGPDGVLLVDTGMEPVNLIAEELKKIGGGEVKYIINTHLNGDHVDGNAALGKDAVIIASEACRRHLESRDNYPEEGLPNLTFKDSLRIHFNGEDIHLYYLPGHTGSDIVVHFKKAKIVCLGDMVFPGSFPGIQAANGGNVFTLKESIGRMVSMFPEDALFINSHGRDYRMVDLKDYYRMIQRTIGLVMPLIEDGLSLKKIIKKKPLKAWKSWNSTFFPGEITTDTWIENIYESTLNRREDSGFSTIHGSYFGQTLPGMTPELFAPGIISTGHHEHSRIEFSKDGSRMFWAVIPVDTNYKTTGTSPFKRDEQTIWYSMIIDGEWAKPAIFKLTQRSGGSTPVFFADGGDDVPLQRNAPARTQSPALQPARPR